MTDFKEKLNELREPEAAPAPVVPQAPLRERKVDAFGRAYATGKRKNAIARVWVKKGKGEFIVNGKPYNEYFARPVLRMIVYEPFKITGRDGLMDVMVTVRGGGLSGQAGAVKHGISRALAFFDPETYRALRQAGFMTRDARVVERKKPGRPKARKRFQFSKR